MNNKLKLNIQMFANDVVNIGYTKIKATPTGENATTGHEMATAFNTNFATAFLYINQLLNYIRKTVLSEQITMLKCDTEGNAYYSTDAQDTPEADINWIKINKAEFSNLEGDPYDCPPLATILNDKASASDVTTLQTQMEGALQNITTSIENISKNTTDIATNASAITDIRDELLYTVHTDGSQTPLYLKYDTTHQIVYISEDNVTWIDINGMNTDWASISGDPADNADLVTYVNTKITESETQASTEYASITDFEDHLNNSNNPHAVTKAQIGLGNVDDTSDLDKPISTATQNALNNLKASSLQVGGVITPTAYQALDSISQNTVYLTSSRN